MSISFQNSLTTRNITSPFLFTGEYVDITAFAEINILLQGTLPLAGDYYVVTAYLSNDRVNVLETIETNVTYPISNKLIKITPIANFIKIKLETFALDVITNFNMSTVLRSVLPLSDTTTVKGGVAIIQSVPLDVSTLPDITIDNTEFKAIGEEPQARFYATPATNTSTVYADGAPGVTVNGGWLSENTATNKINWYVYANTASQASTSKKLEDIKDMYMVIYQKPTAISDIKNPFIAFYSLPEAANNTSWYKNKYVYCNYDDASEVGTKLLYIGMDNPLIHPEITKRIKLDYDPISSTNTIEAGANETLWLSSVHTSSNTAAGKYNFVFSEFGLNFNQLALNSTVLPIIDNKVQVAGSVALTNTFIHTREEPTQLAFRNNGGSNIGIVLYNGPRVLRALSISNVSTEIIYVHIYNMATIPTSSDISTWLIPIAPNVASNIMNQTDHYFSTGLAFRVTTDFNNDVSPASNVCFLNGSIGY